MADYEPPSFSLGLDLGFDTELQTAPTDHSTSPASAPDPPRGSTFRAPVDVDVEEEKLGPQISGLDPEIGPQPTRANKRLKRGLAEKPEPTTPFRNVDVQEEELRPQISGLDPEIVPQPTRALKRLKRGLAEKREPTTPFRNVDDDIEEFSSQEDIFQDVHPSAQYQTFCSSSKIPLHASGVLTSQSSCHGMGKKRKPVSNPPGSVSLEASHKGLIFPKLTTSPLRKFHLIDSDSDDPSVNDVSWVTCNVDPSSKKQHSTIGHSATTSETKKKLSMSMPKDVDEVDLWKDIIPIKKFNIPTPAFDEVCQEYFQSVKDKTTPKLERDACPQANERFHETTPGGQDVEQFWNVTDPLPPAHHYFFHDDPKIQKLVRNRLPNFFPLGGVDMRGNQQHGASVIDYMGQFSNGETSKKQVNQQIDLDKSSKRRSKSNISNVEDVLHTSGSWMNPKAGKATQGMTSKKGRRKSENSNASGNWVEPRSCASNKRIQANAQSSGERYAPGASGQATGHWYTGAGGGKVYVSKTGQEFRGQTAYRLYRKESGAQSAKEKKAKKAKARK